MLEASPGLPGEVAGIITTRPAGTWAPTAAFSARKAPRPMTAVRGAPLVGRLLHASEGWSYSGGSSWFSRIGSRACPAVRPGGCGVSLRNHSHAATMTTVSRRVRRLLINTASIEASALQAREAEIRQLIDAAKAAHDAVVEVELIAPERLRDLAIAAMGSASQHTKEDTPEFGRRRARSTVLLLGTIRSASPLTTSAGCTMRDRSAGCWRPHAWIAFNCPRNVTGEIAASRSSVRCFSRARKSRAVCLPLAVWV